MAQHIMQNGFITSHKFHELSIVSRYLHSIGFTKKEIEKNIIEFCEKYYTDFNYILNMKMIDILVKTSSKLKVRQLGKLPITESDMEYVDNINNLKQKKIFFAMLCLFKINYILNDNRYVKEKDNIVAKMADLKPVKDVNYILHELCQAGFFRSCSNGSTERLFELDMESPIVFEIGDVDNAWLYYLNHKQGGYTECRECGKIVKSAKAKQYCDTCAKRKIIESKREWKRNYDKKI